MAFPQSFLDELVARSDIVDVVGSYVALTKKGANYFGLCPFHNEKTGSFSVSPDKQIYHCFGCKKGGGVISFIMEEENLSFPDAVRFLAKRANLPVPEEEQGESSRLRARLLELNRDAARFYYELLHDKRGEACAENLNQRRSTSGSAQAPMSGTACSRRWPERATPKPSCSPRDWSCRARAAACTISSASVLFSPSSTYAATWSPSAGASWIKTTQAQNI